MIREMMLDCLLIIGGSAAHGRLWFQRPLCHQHDGQSRDGQLLFFNRFPPQLVQVGR